MKTKSSNRKRRSSKLQRRASPENKISNRHGDLNFDCDNLSDSDFSDDGDKHLYIKNERSDRRDDMKFQRRFSAEDEKSGRRDDIKWQRRVSAEDERSGRRAAEDERFLTIGPVMMNLIITA